MKVGVIGSGMVGQVLATAFLNEGHEVTLGTRNTSKEEVLQWKAANEKGQVGSFADTAKFGELLVLAVAGLAAEEAVQLAGAANFSGKILIDATNPIAKEAPEGGVIKYFTGPNESLMERLQKAIPEAKLVKAFSSVGNHLMYKPAFKEGRPTMFICGDDAGAKEKVSAILSDFGWDVADMGGVQGARAIEPLAMLWCIPGFLQNQWGHAFKLLRS